MDYQILLLKTYSQCLGTDDTYYTFAIIMNREKEKSSALQMYLIYSYMLSNI